MLMGPLGNPSQGFPSYTWMEALARLFFQLPFLSALGKEG